MIAERAEEASEEPSFDDNYITLIKEGVTCVSHKWKQAHCESDVMSLVIIQCYFALTTLSTIGYGDLYPITTNEMFVGIIFMLIGIVFFSQIMGSFINIVQNYDQRMGNDESNSDLTNWMALLIRFTNSPLPESLIN